MNVCNIFEFSAKVRSEYHRMTPNFVPIENSLHISGQLTLWIKPNLHKDSEAEPINTETTCTL